MSFLKGSTIFRSNNLCGDNITKKTNMLSITDQINQLRYLSPTDLG